LENPLNITWDKSFPCQGELDAGLPSFFGAQVYGRKPSSINPITAPMASVGHQNYPSCLWQGRFACWLGKRVVARQLEISPS